MRWGVISWQPHPDCGGQARPFPAGKFGRGRGVEEDPVFSGVRGKAAALFTCSGAASAPADALPDLQALRRRSEAARGWDGRRPDRTRPPPARRGGGRRAAEEEGGIGGRRYLRGAGASSSAPSLLRLLRAPRHHLRTAQRGLGAEGSGGVPGRMPPFYLPAAGEVSKAEFLPPPPHADQGDGRRRTDGPLLPGLRGARREWDNSSRSLLRGAYSRRQQQSGPRRETTSGASSASSRLIPG